MGEEILKEVLRLAVGSGLPLTVTLGLLVVAAILMVVGRRFGGITWPSIKVEPPPYSDGGGGDGGPSGPGVPLNTDPANPGGDSHGG